MHEIETKVLEVDKEELKQKLESLGAKQIQSVRLVVDWYGPKGLTHDGDDPWYLRVRSYSGEKYEVTWKAKSDILGAARKHKEINFTVSDPERIGDLLLELDLEKYAHQEKDRTSWVLNDWQFDLDEYPGMPAYLEIEGKSEEHIQEALKLLNLENHKNSSQGERALIKEQYGLNWFDMKF